jgi:DNA-binding GntR family transcriptional regulator
MTRTLPMPLDHYADDERQAQGRKLAKARAAAAEALRVAQVMARSAHGEGVAETQIAADLGVDRMTVRKWLGKR